MKIRDLLAAESIELNGKVTGKKETLDAMVDLMAKSGKINDVEVYRKGVYAREEESTTGIGEGIAIPHCKSDSVSRPGLAAMVVPEGVDFDSLDGEKVNLIFLIAAPNTKENVHLDVLSKLSVLLMDEDFTTNLRNAKTVDEFLHVIDAAEAEKDAEEEKKEEENSYAYTADFTTHLFKTHPEIDGIIYPSARLKEEGIGVNVAIRPEVIDNAFELKACSVCRYFKRNKKQQLILNYKHSRFRQNGKIYYVIDREFYRDLDFKNTEYDFKTLQFKY